MSMADLTVCLGALMDVSKDDLFKMSFACGRALPRDAGKFSSCLAIPGARYYLASMTATLQMPTPAPHLISDGEVSAEPVALGLCLPEVCKASIVPSLLRMPEFSVLVPGLSHLNIQEVVVQDPVHGLQPAGIGFCIAAGFVLGLLLLVLASTLYQKRRASVPENSDAAPGLEQSTSTSRSPWQLISAAFALTGPRGSLTSLLSVPSKKPTDCLNGMRVLSMVWIILGHTFLMPEGISGYTNPQDIELSPVNPRAAETSPWLQIVIGAEISVDTFFFQSGFLLSMLTLKELRSGRMNIIMACVLRYLRLTPNLALAMLIYFKIWAYLGSGPFAWQFQESILSRCQGSWWSELTYTMNFVPFDSNAVCMGWTWYLGNDMIFFVFGVLLLPVYHRSKRLGWFCALALVTASIGITAGLVFKYHLSVYVFDHHYTDYSYWAYSKPYTRIPAYLVGVAAAWILDDLEAQGNQQEDGARGQNVTKAFIAGTLSIAGLAFLLFIPSTDFGATKNSWGDITSFLYIAFGRMLWAVCWATITLLCYYGYLPYIDACLSHSFWTPFARLTYGAYLMHPLVIKLSAGRAYQYYDFGSMELFYRLLGNTVFAYSGSLFLYVLAEKPMMTLTSTRKRNEVAKPVSTPMATTASAANASGV
eukprot:TRINITY_DN103101_c0_g1_i1.p1 TRINITY_DN103101_c0_g1~~TRINITY_DN103101_c0_g1_i1.p1  ORF type:complete len:648 (+),score=77.67 TRINITY_DN103101_c0_g1_i1:44-1987(+)